MITVVHPKSTKISENLFEFFVLHCGIKTFEAEAIRILDPLTTD